MRKGKRNSSKLKIGKKVVNSTFEYNSYLTMKANLPKGASLEFESEKLVYFLENNYVPDFIITFKDGRKLYIETKGFFPYRDRRKMLQVRENNPDLDIRIIFQRDSPSCLGKGSKKRPSDWCNDNDFQFSIGEIPKEWLE